MIEVLIYSLAAAGAGVAITLLAQRIMGANKKQMVKVWSLVLSVIAVLAVAFSIDWGYASYLEGEPQAASIGFLVFGGIGIVFGLAAFRLMTMKAKSEEAEAEEVVLTA